MTDPRALAPAIAVTGATGFIGRHLCERFRRAGWDVRALARGTEPYPFAVEGIRLFRCDLPDVLDEDAVRGARVLVHCAYTTRHTDLETARRVNELGTRRVLEVGRALGVEGCVFLSSQSAHEEARSYYGKSKFELERLFALERDVVIRAGFVLGKAGSGLFHRMCEMVGRARVIPLFGGGRQPLQTIHVEDLCDAVEAAVGKGLTGRFTVAEPAVTEVRELLRAIARRLGRRPVFVPFPMAPALAVLQTVEALRIPFPVSSENLLGLACLRVDDTTRDLAALGVTPRGTAESLDEILGRPASAG